MTKEQIGKEIKELIRSIKTHYTFVEEEDRIPLIELELITSKIRKLYEKSIINNYLHSNDENYMSQERSRRFHERKNFEKTLSEKSAVRNEDNAVNTIAPILQTHTVVVPPIEKLPEAPPEISRVTEPSTPTVTNANSSNRSLKDIKLLIGINDKFLLINNLFNRNDLEYKSVIEMLSSLHSIEASMDQLNRLAKQYEWNTESYAFKRLLQIIEKRFK